ncbi:methyltransferase [Nesterenkonia sp. F]|uniref:DUF7059 domain-containing protein n=1 Tax=Nesterenkonia sp. F TaxID=795955 RepID=UPI000255CCFB|nr:methyltransferase [Nesterenkonia sp. F]
MSRLTREQAAAVAAPTSDDVALVEALRADLAAAEFTNDALSAVLGEEAVAALDRDQIVPGQLRVQQLLQDEHPPASAVMSALWLLDLEVSAGQLAAAFPRTGLDGLRRLGLVLLAGAGSGRPDDGGPVLPAVDLRPYQVGAAREGASAADLWVTSDLGAHQVDGALPPEHVLGIGQASLTLASTTHRRRVATALDLGTGCGIQLFHLLDHAEHVVGTDLSERALAFARFNLILNAEALGLDPRRLQDRVELLPGSLLEPVAGRRFDLIVSNPPFVITPRTAEEAAAAETGDTGDGGEERYTYRDGGRVGDELMAELVSTLPDALADGGTAQLLGNWEIPAAGEEDGLGEDAAEDAVAGEDVPAGPDWSTRPRRWLAALDAAERSAGRSAAPVDAWFLQRDRQDGPGYAETWLRDAAEERDVVDFRRRYAAYLRDFRLRGVAEVGFGMIWLRRRPADEAGEPWRRFEELTHPVEQPLGPTIGATTERADRARREPEAVLGERLVAASDVTDERHQRFGASDPEIILARQGAGLRRVRPVSSGAAGVLGAADGEFAADQLITAVGALLDDGVVDVEALTDSLREEVLELVVDGFLVPAE